MKKHYGITLFFILATATLGSNAHAAAQSDHPARTLQLDPKKRVRIVQNPFGSTFIRNQGDAASTGIEFQHYSPYFRFAYDDASRNALYEALNARYGVAYGDLSGTNTYADKYPGQWISFIKKTETATPTLPVHSTFVPEETLDTLAEKHEKFGLIFQIKDNKVTTHFEPGSLYNFFVPSAALEKIVNNEMLNPKKYSLDQAQQAREEAIKVRSCIWKIHLQVKPNYLLPFLADFLPFILTDYRLRNIYDFKVARLFTKGQHLPDDKGCLSKSPAPIVVLYVKNFFSETHAERNAVVDPIIQALVERYDDNTIGLDITPRCNAKINKLVYIAQDNFDQKALFFKTRGHAFMREIYTPNLAFVKGYEYIIPQFAWHDRSEEFTSEIAESQPESSELEKGTDCVATTEESTISGTVTASATSCSSPEINELQAEPAMLTKRSDQPLEQQDTTKRRRT
ncbi:hypothetical protein K2W90_01050 [Candidatus Babeliales bacterium]|nr:hypothetical protein [Candidatus Babeliales bacterium]